MRAARCAAFFALSTPTAATGTPGGICAIASSASSPSRTLSDDFNGTPITGRSVCAATAPGSAAARPAPQISTRRPRSRAVFEYSATASGFRGAERTSNSQPIPCSSRTSIAPCIRSRTDSDPTRMPTFTSAIRDVPPVAHAGEIYAGDGVVRGSSRGGDRVSRPDHVQHAAAVRHELPVLQRRSRVEDERPRRLGVLDAGDRRAGVAALRVFAAREDDGDGGALRELRRGQVAGEQRQQVGVEPRQHRLRLGIAEAAVELDHLDPGLGADEAGVEAPLERRAALRELAQPGGGTVSRGSSGAGSPTAAGRGEAPPAPPFAAGSPA